MDVDDMSQSQLDDMPMSKRAKMEGPDSDRLLNFATAADEFELNLKRQKMPRDPMSHRIIEKRRRDRMNNCLADLSRLIPSSYHKQGQGRIEKTEIIEMAIKHINMLQQRVDKLSKGGMESDKTPSQSTSVAATRDCCGDKFYMGFKEAQDEVMRFLVEVESVSVMDPFCKKIMKHLENASKKFIVEQKMSDIDAGESTGPEADGNSQSNLFQHSAYYPQSSSGQSSMGDICSKDDKHHDKQLRSLLGEQQQSSYNFGNNSERNSNGMVPMFSYALSSMGTATDSSVVGSSGYVSDLSNMEKSSRDNVYKFKHNITKRFSQEGHHHHHSSHHNQPSDTSSNTSSRDFDDDQGQFKWKVKHKGRSSYHHDETEGPSRSSNSNLDDSPPALHSGDIQVRRKSSSKPNPQNATQSGETLSGPPSSSSSVALPGFILHPTGTHYMPISVHNTNIADLFESNADQEGMPVFHPISIPVHFRRPVISMPNITICGHITSQQQDRNSKD